MHQPKLTPDKEGFIKIIYRQSIQDIAKLILQENATMKTENKITYTEVNDINYPNLTLPEQTNLPIGKYGQLRLNFIKKHRRGTYISLLTTAKLNEHLAMLDAEALRMVDLLTAQLAKQQGIDEALKAKDMLDWVQGMNDCKALAEEIALCDVVYK